MPRELAAGWRRRVSVALVLAVLGAAVGALVTFLLRLADEIAPPWYFVVIGAFAGLAAALIVPLASRPILQPVPAHGPTPSPVPMLAPLADLEQRVGSGTRHAAAFRNGLQPILRDLVDDRLMRAIGTDFDTAVAAEPECIRRYLGAELWSCLQPIDDADRAPSMTELLAGVDRLGSL